MIPVNCPIISFNMFFNMVFIQHINQHIIQHHVVLLIVSVHRQFICVNIIQGIIWTCNGIPLYCCIVDAPSIGYGPWKLIIPCSQCDESHSSITL